MARVGEWHGTDDEAIALLEAVGNNCACSLSPYGERRTRCSGHAMLSDDQRALDGLLFVRQVAARLQAEEWCIPG